MKQLTLLINYLHDIKAYCLSLLFVVFSVMLSFSQTLQPQFEHLTNADGLSNSTINCIYQDRMGFVWFGTHIGLNRYDGNNIKRYYNNPHDTNSLTSNRIFCIAEDQDGDLIIGTSEGISVYKRATDSFKQYKFDKNKPNGVPIANILCVLVDSKNNIWIGGYWSSGIIQFDKKAGTFITHKISKTSTDNVDIYSFADNKDGKIWLTTQLSVGLYNPTDNSFETITNNDFSAWTNGKHLFLDNDHNLWIGDEGRYGLIRYHIKTKTFTYFDQFKTKIIRDIKQGHDGNIWIAGDHIGLFVFNPQKQSFQHFIHNDNDDKSLSNNQLYSLLCDNSGIVWVGTYGGGVNIYNKNKYKFDCYKPIAGNDNSLSFRSVLAIEEDKNRNVWIGTDGGGLDKFVYTKDSSTFTHYRKNDASNKSISSNVIKCIFEDKIGNLWLGTFNGGVTRFNYLQNEFERFVPGLSVNDNKLGGNHTWEILQDSYGTFWISCLGVGVDTMDQKINNRFYHINNNTEKSFPNAANVVFVIKEDSQKRLWLGSEGGGLLLFEREKGTFRNFEFNANDNNSIRNNAVRAIFEDSEQQLWFGTGGGGLDLLKRDFSGFIHHTVDNGLPSNIISDIEEDDHKNLWISTSQGISKFSLETKTFKNYDKSDGLQGDEFNFNAGTKAADGRIYFGGIEGFNAFYPDQITDNAFIPPVYITNFYLFNKPVEINDKYKILSKSINITDTIVLKHDQSVITFEFAALNFTNSHRNQYAYYMQGFEKDWNYVGSEHKATYTNLNPGTYQFKVKASNNDGVWNETGKTMTIIVLPPWYQTWWFRTMIGILLFLALFTFYKVRIRVIEAQKNNLEQQVKQRTSEVLQQKEELAQTLGIVNQQKEELTQALDLVSLQKEQIERTLHNLQTTQKKLVEAEKMASLGNLVAGVAHEINTPVGIAITSVSMVINEIKELVEKYENNDMSASDFEKYVQQFYDGNALALKNLERTAGLVRSFKQISLDQHSEQERKFNLNDYLHDILASINPEFKHTQIKIAIDCPPDLVISSYPGAFAQIFTNLLTNSKRHGFRNRNEGQINIVVKRENEKLIMEYTDNGHGINEKVLPRIFDPFFTTDMQGGTGLGLNIVYNLVTQKLGGEIRCESREGEGVRFLMQLSS